MKSPASRKLLYYKGCWTSRLEHRMRETSLTIFRPDKSSPRHYEVFCKQKPSMPESIENRLLDTASEEKVVNNQFRLVRSSFQIRRVPCKQKSQVLKRTENSQRESQLVEISLLTVIKHTEPTRMCHEVSCKQKSSTLPSIESLSL
jgi:hypothetical protein